MNIKFQTTAERKICAKIVLCRKRALWAGNLETKRRGIRYRLHYFLFFLLIYARFLAGSWWKTSYLICPSCNSYMWLKESSSGGQFWSRTKIGSGMKNCIGSYGKDLVFCIFLENERFYCKIRTNLIYRMWNFL